MKSYEYSEDSRSITVKTSYTDPVVVPVDILDFLNSVHISDSTLEELKAFRRTTQRDASDNVVSVPEQVEVSTLEGVNLVGKTVRFYFANWEDSEWLETSAALTVVKTNHDMYRFVFAEEDLYHNPEKYPEEEYYDRIPYDVERMIGVTLCAKERVWVSND